MASRRMKKKWLNEGLLLLLPCHQAIIQRELGSTGRFKDTCRQPDRSLITQKKLLVFLSHFNASPQTVTLQPFISDIYLPAH